MKESLPSRDAGGVSVFWWVCTKNPFYAVSAVLVLLGLWVSFGNVDEELDTWLLMGGLAAYTLLLAGTAMVLVRYLKLWDDARTVMLLVVLMFLATSVTFDHLLVIDQERGTIFNLLGLGLSVAVSELLLRGIKLRLPAHYRGPYYLMLMLFFLYPVFVRSLYDLDVPEREPALWALFGFATAAGLVALTLLPALRRGEDYVRGNGSPWAWPYYPWSLFVVLAIAVPGRAVMMCWSLHLDKHFFDRLIFGPYFLVPFVFAVSILFLELALSLGKTRMIRVAMLLPLAMLGLAIIGHNPSDPVYRLLRVMTVSIRDHNAFGKVSEVPDPVYEKFLSLFTDRLGADPLFMTLLLAVVFYAYAAARRVPRAVEALAASLAAMAVIGTHALTNKLIKPIEPEPLLLPGLILLALGARQRNPWTLLGGAGCLAAASALAVPLPEPAIAWVRPVIFLQLTVLAMLALGAIFTGAAGINIRRMGAGVVLVLALLGAHEWYVEKWIPPATPIVYPLCVGLVLVLYGHFRRDSWILVMAAVILGYWVFKFGWTAYRAMRGAVRGFDYLVSGLGFFMLAVLVSLAKSGVLARWVGSHWKLPMSLRTMIGTVPVLAPGPMSPGLELAAAPDVKPATPRRESSESV